MTMTTVVCSSCNGSVGGCDACLHTGKDFPFNYRTCFDEPCPACISHGVGDTCERRLALLNRTCLNAKHPGQPERCGAKASYVICGEPFCGACAPAVKASYNGLDDCTISLTKKGEALARKNTNEPS
jgi:hypothetical protein